MKWQFSIRILSTALTRALVRDDFLFALTLVLFFCCEVVTDNELLNCALYAAFASHWNTREYARATARAMN